MAKAEFDFKYDHKKRSVEDGDFEFTYDHKKRDNQNSSPDGSSSGSTQSSGTSDATSNGQGSGSSDYLNSDSSSSGSSNGSSDYSSDASADQNGSTNDYSSSDDKQNAGNDAGNDYGTTSSSNGQVRRLPRQTITAKVKVNPALLHKATVKDKVKQPHPAQVLQPKARKLEAAKLEVAITPTQTQTLELDSLEATRDQAQQTTILDQDL